MAVERESLGLEPAPGLRGGLGYKKTLTCLRCMSLFVMNFLVLILQALSDMLTL